MSNLKCSSTNFSRQREKPIPLSGRLPLNYIKLGSTHNCPLLSQEGDYPETLMKFDPYCFKIQNCGQFVSNFISLHTSLPHQPIPLNDPPKRGLTTDHLPPTLHNSPFKSDESKPGVSNFALLTWHLNKVPSFHSGKKKAALLPKNI